MIKFCAISLASELLNNDELPRSPKDPQKASFSMHSVSSLYGNFKTDCPLFRVLFGSCRKQLWFFTSLAILVFTGSAAAQNVNITWDPSGDSNIATYSLYYGNSSGSYSATIDSQDQTFVTLNSLAPGTYYCVATARNSDGIESSPSQELIFQVQPMAPTFSNLISGGSLNGPQPIALQLSSAAANFARVEVWVGTVKVGQTAAVTCSSAITWQPPAAGTYTLTIKAFDQSGTEYDAPPEIVTIVTPAIKDMQWTADSLQFSVVGAPGSTQSIYVSDDLQTWTLLETEVNNSGTMQVQDPDAVSRPQEFYKVVSE